MKVNKVAPDWTRAQKDHRNAKNRVARAARRNNRKS